MENLIEKAYRLTRYWWVLLAFGVITFILGLLVFVYPGTSYMTLARVFAVVILVSGLTEIIMAFSENYLPGRGWVAIGGTLEFIIGLVLLFNPAISAIALPFVLAFWMMLKGFSEIGLASDLRAMKVSGMGWSIFSGLLLILCGVAILFLPMVGTKIIIIMLGVGLLLAGISISAFAIEIYALKKPYREFKNSL